jgi:hypothetical protein
VDLEFYAPWGLILLQSLLPDFNLNVCKKELFPLQNHSLQLWWKVIP